MDYGSRLFYFFYCRIGFIMFGLMGFIVLFGQGNPAGLILFLFGALGVFLIYRGVIAPDKYEKIDEENEFIRYLIVEEIHYIENSNKAVVEMKSLGDPFGVGCIGDETTNHGMFKPNDKFMYDMRIFDNRENHIVQFKGKPMVDISFFTESDFRKCNAVVGGIFNLMQKKGMF